MIIEADARRHITDAIEVEKNLSAEEKKEKAKGKILLGNENIEKYCKKLVNLMCSINQVANTEGIGRDDLGVEILRASDGIIRRVSMTQSKAVRLLAQQIKASFLAFRKLMQKYSLNIEVVDP